MQSFKTLIESVSWGQSTVDNINYLTDLAKSKPDGVYKARGIGYRVHNKNLTHYHANNGSKRTLYLNYTHFSSPIGSYDSSDEAHKALRNIK